jgi:hypothetical protein
MKIVIIKSFADDYDSDHLQTDQDINSLSYALTKKFLNKDGVLFQRLLNQFHLVPNIRIVLMAEQNEAKEVVSLRLYIDRKDLWMTQEISQAVRHLYIRIQLKEYLRTLPLPWFSSQWPRGIPFAHSASFFLLTILEHKNGDFYKLSILSKYIIHDFLPKRFLWSIFFE